MVAKLKKRSEYIYLFFLYIAGSVACRFLVTCFKDGVPAE